MAICASRLPHAFRATFPPPTPPPPPQVTFTPPLTANTPHALRAPVRVNGGGRGAALILAGAGEAPQLLVEPALLDMGPALPGEAASAALVLRNAGAYAIRVRFQAWRIGAVQGIHPSAAPPSSPTAICELLDARLTRGASPAPVQLPGCQAALPHAALQVVAADWDSEYLEDERRLAAWEGWNTASHICCPEAAVGTAAHMIESGLLVERGAPASARVGALCAADAPTDPVRPASPLNRPACAGLHGSQIAVLCERAALIM